ADDEEVSAEIAPLQDPEYYRYDIDIAEVAELWRRGSVVASWLLDLTAGALVSGSDLDGYGGRVSDSGEGRWTIHAAIDEGVPVPVLSAALYQRFGSRGESQYADKLLSAMRQQFGGHAELPVNAAGGAHSVAAIAACPCGARSCRSSPPRATPPPPPARPVRPPRWA